MVIGHPTTEIGIICKGLVRHAVGPAVTALEAGGKGGSTTVITASPIILLHWVLMLAVVDMVRIATLMNGCRHRCVGGQIIIILLSIIKAIQLLILIESFINTTVVLLK